MRKTKVAEKLKRKTSPLLLAGLFLASCHTVMGQENSKICYYNTDFTLSKSNFVDTIPIIYRGNQVYIEATIEGKTYLLNLDTGSSQGVLYEGGRIPHSQPLGHINTRDANGRTQGVPVVAFPTLRIGRLRIGNYRATLIRRPTGRYPYDGIIGFDLFNKGLQAKIDTRNGYLILTDRKNFFDRETGFNLKYKLCRWVPYLLINTFEKHEEPTLFDTGSEDFFTFNKQSFDTERYKNARVVDLIEETTNGQQTIGNFGAEESDLLFYIKLNRLWWGKFCFLNVHTYTSQGDSRIGGEVLKYGAFVINPYRKLIKFQPYAASNHVSVDNKMMDITYVPINGRATVGTIRHRSRQYKQGFRQGDTITGINGTPISTFADFQNYHFVKGERYTFRLHSQRGFDKEVTVERWGED